MVALFPFRANVGLCVSKDKGYLVFVCVRTELARFLAREMCVSYSIDVLSVPDAFVCCSSGGERIGLHVRPGDSSRGTHDGTARIGEGGREG